MLPSLLVSHYSLSLSSCFTPGTDSWFIEVTIMRACLEIYSHSTLLKIFWKVPKRKSLEFKEKLMKMLGLLCSVSKKLLHITRPTLGWFRMKLRISSILFIHIFNHYLLPGIRFKKKVALKRYLLCNRVCAIYLW